MSSFAGSFFFAGVFAGGGRRVLVAGAAVAGALLAVTGCSSSSSSSSSASVLPSAALVTPGASASALPAATAQLTGTQLESVLLPDADFPAGFATPSGSPVSSGGALTSAPAKYNLATVSCATFIQHLGTTGFGETAMVSGSVAGSGQAYDQFIYQFGSASGASAFVDGIQALAGRCGSFKASDNGSTGTFSLSAAPGPSVAGHPTLRLTQTGTVGGSKVVLNALLSASGVDVFAAAGAGAGGMAAPATPTSETLIYNLMKRQAAVALLT